MSDSFDKTLSGGKFDEVFTEVSHAETLGLKNPEQLRLFHLNVNNNAFSSDQLEVFLRKNIGQYVFSRAQIEKQSTQERILAENTVFSKSFDQDTIQRIKDLLVPSKGPKVPCGTAYGVFLAYNLGLKAANYSGVDFRRALTQKMDTDIRNHASYIASKINALGLDMHSFYFYILPLNDADVEKTQIMDRVMNGGGKP